MARSPLPVPALLVALALAAGCGTPPPPPAATQTEDSAAAYAGEEAARTGRMEDEAAAIRDRWAEVQEMEGTPEEKQRAVEELMARERALMRDGEGEAPAAEEETPED